MKAALIGFGKMGKLLYRLSSDYTIAVTSIILPEPTEEKKQEVLPTVSFSTTLTDEIIDSVDVVIDFSSPDGILARIEQIAKKKKPQIIGTTGWDDQKKIAQGLIEKNQAACIAQANFSLGVALFKRLTAFASELFSPFDHYDVGLFEMHHREKKDHPSGTAKMLGHTLLNHMQRKKSLVSELPQGVIGENQLHVTALRTGFHPGLHQVIFDSPDDTIFLTHSAKNREDFARGALLSALWLEGKSGWRTFDEVINDKIQNK